MSHSDPIALIDGSRPFSLCLAMANRHGLVAGATGTGKTVSLQRLAECLSAAGTAVFAADIKGDLSGIAAPGGGNPKIEAALEEAAKLAPGMDIARREGLGVRFWDVYAERGAPLRATVTDMGPLILSRALALSEVQDEVLSVIFKLADDRGLELVDLKDLRAVIDFCARNAVELEKDYGRMSPVTLSSIQRSVVVLEGQGGDLFFGEPALDIHDFIARDASGRGVVSVLAADRLVENPALYSAFLLWLLSELFEELPEAGDLPAPKIVFFFDEAHLLFEGAPPELVRTIVRTVKLIRSKGVGVWFVTQNPSDLPEEVLAQLGNRVQHALRAYTPKELKGVKAAAESFRENPKLDTYKTITELGVGEALVSFLDDKGVPMPVERARIIPPLSRVGPLSQAERAALLACCGMMQRYGIAVDRPSAYEKLRQGAADRQSSASSSKNLDQAMADLEAELHGRAPCSGSASSSGGPDWGEPLRPAPPTAQRPERQTNRARESRQGDFIDSLAKGAVRAAANELSRQLVRGMLGGLSGGSRRRR